MIDVRRVETQKESKIDYGKSPRLNKLKEEFLGNAEGLKLGMLELLKPLFTRIGCLPFYVNILVRVANNLSSKKEKLLIICKEDRKRRIIHSKSSKNSQLLISGNKLSSKERKNFVEMKQLQNQIKNIVELLESLLEPLYVNFI